MIPHRPGNLHFFRSLLRVHGSALYRALVPSLFSSGILLVLEFTSDEPSYEVASRWIQHPYPITCMMVAFTFLLTFKCSFSYNRYWEACTAIHQMQSKWLDVGMELAAFHLQSERFSHIKPPSFGQHPHIDHVVRKRERLRPMTPRKLKEMLVDENQNIVSDASSDSSSHIENKKKNKKRRSSSSFKRIKSALRKTSRKKRSLGKPSSFVDWEYEEPSSPVPHKSINFNSSYDQSKSLAAGVFNSGNQSSNLRKRPGLSTISSVADLSGGMSKKMGPSLFLQEASHLISLLSAVSFATLRNDIENAESPLQHYTPGSAWPPVDPDSKDAGVYDEFDNFGRFLTSIRYLFGYVRSPAQRTVYNACRPFTVLGGVSDAEIDVLQCARGPLAKTALCTMWLQEFISREFLNGALGGVSPPIVSRLFQYTSDGMIGYNQARKVAYVPFPFPHSQLTTFFLLVVTCFMPILMLTFVSEIIVATVLNAMAVGIFFGKFCFK
jgi:hypothetical protein